MTSRSRRAAVRLMMFLCVGFFSVSFWTAPAHSAEIVAPPPGSVLPNSTATFTVETGNETFDSSWFYVGSSRYGYDYGRFYIAPNAAASQFVSDLPTDGSTIYLTYFYLTGGSWKNEEAIYTVGSERPEFVSPLPGSELPGSTTTFTVDTNNNTIEHSWFYVGSTAYGWEYGRFYKASGAAASQIVSELPTDGSIIHLTYFYRIGGRWYNNTATYTAADATPPISSGSFTNMPALELPSCEDPETCTHPKVDDAITSLPVLSIRYMPDVDADGLVDLDTTGVNWPVDELRQRINDIENGTAWWVTEATRPMGRANPAAIPSIGFDITDRLETLEAVPLGLPVPWYTNVNRPDYRGILDSIDICRRVDAGIREVWMWTQHHGDIEPAESNLYSSIGDISNSERSDDLPNCNLSYTVYNFNFTRGIAEAIHNRGHQAESLYRHGTDRALWDEFEERCGNTHFPPNGTSDYDYRNPTPVTSTCEGWLDGTGSTAQYSCATHNSWTYGDPTCVDDGGLSFYVWWFQRIPGQNGSATLNSVPIRPWWDLFARLDHVIRSGTWLLREITD